MHLNYLVTLHAYKNVNNKNFFKVKKKQINYKTGSKLSKCDVTCTHLKLNIHSFVWLIKFSFVKCLTAKDLKYIKYINI